MNTFWRTNQDKFLRYSRIGFMLVKLELLGLLYMLASHVHIVKAIIAIKKTTLLWHRWQDYSCNM